MRKHENSSYHKRHKFTEGVSIFYLELFKPLYHEENSVSKLTQKKIIR